jgi:amino acid transporter
MGTHRASSSEQRRLGQDVVGVRHIVFMVLGAAAPMAAIVGAMPVAVALGDGKGFAGAYVLAAIVLALFAVGYAAMSRHVTDAGAFYSYVARVGRHAGSAAGYVALLAYNAVAIALSAAFAFFAHSSLADILHVDLTWQVWWAIGVAFAAALSYRGITLTARILGGALMCEIVVLLVFDVAVLADKGLGGFSTSVFSPNAVFSGAAGIGILYAFTSFVGFEQAAIYGEEARNPERTVARATYISLAIVAVFYTLTTWSALSAYGANQAQAAAARSPSRFVFTASQAELGTLATKAIEVLVVTSLFAGFLAFHQGAARYFFALSRDGLSLRALGLTHRHHGTPHVAQAVQLAIVVAVVGSLALLGLDPYLQIAAPALALGTLGVILLQAAAGISIAVFFRRRQDERLWVTLVAPLFSSAGLIAAAILVVANFGTLVGTSSTVIRALPWAYLVAVAIGLAAAALAQGRRAT